MLKNCLFGTYRAPATMNATAECHCRSPLERWMLRLEADQVVGSVHHRPAAFWARRTMHVEAAFATNRLFSSVMMHSA
jgi:hypothetical protein